MHVIAFLSFYYIMSFILYKLKNEIKYRAKNIGLSEDKICIKEGIEQKLGQNQNESNFKNQSQQLRRGKILDLEEITTEELELF